MLVFGSPQTSSVDRVGLVQKCRCRCYMIHRRIGLDENPEQESPLIQPSKPSLCPSTTEGSFERWFDEAFVSNDSGYSVCGSAWGYMVYIGGLLGRQVTKAQ